MLVLVAALVMPFAGCEEKTDEEKALEKIEQIANEANKDLDKAAKDLDAAAKDAEKAAEKALNDLK